VENLLQKPTVHIGTGKIETGDKKPTFIARNARGSPKNENLSDRGRMRSDNLGQPVGDRSIDGFFMKKLITTGIKKQNQSKKPEGRRTAG
jgi:hypothetical protein